MQELFLELPLPPTINSYYGQSGFRRYMTEKGKKFKAEVAHQVSLFPIRYGDSRLSVTIYLHFRDERRADISNRIKALEDALVQAGLFNDDSQIDEEHIYRKEIIREGKTKVMIKVLDPVA